MNKKLAGLYISLLTSGSSSASKISKVTGIHRVDIYRRLDELSAVGLCKLKLGRPKLYEAIDPSDALESIIRRKETDLSDMLREKKKLEVALRSISSSNILPRRDESGQFNYELVVGFDQGLQAFKRSLRMANNELLRVIEPEMLILNYKKGLIDEYVQCQKRGIRVEIISDFRNIPKRIANLCVKWFDVRNLNINKMHFAIIDRKIAVLNALENETSGAGNSSARVRTLFVDDEMFTNVIVQIFEHLWDSGQKINREL